MSPARSGAASTWRCTHIGLARDLFEHYPDERAEAAEHLTIATREAQAMKMKPLLEDASR